MLFLFISIFLPLSTITGTVVDNYTLKPLSDVNVVLEETVVGAITNEDGDYWIRNVSPEEYMLKASRIGYKPSRVKILVQNQTIIVNFKLEEKPIEMGGIEVTGKFAPLSKNLMNAQIRSHPENIDLHHVLASLPGIGTLEDYNSSISVRGGDPDENLTIIDGIEIPYPVHFGWFGGEGGAISIVNTNLIKDIGFYTGGFPVRFGNKLSSVIDIRLKETTARRFNLDLNIADKNLTIGGGIKDKWAYLANYKKSHLDIWRGTLGVASALPSYTDYFLKTTFNPNPQNKFELIGFNSDDKLYYSGEVYNNPYGVKIPELEIKWENYQTSGGIIWKYANPRNLSSTIAISRSAVTWDAFQKDRGEVKANETVSSANSHFSYRISHRNEFKIGLIYKYLNLYHYYYFAPDTTPTSIPLPGDTIQSSVVTYAMDGYFEHTFHPASFISLRSGVRAGYFDLSRAKACSPRISIIYSLSRRNILTCSWGEYYQLPKYLDFAENSNLRHKKAVHYTVGFKHILSKESEVVIDIYKKNYSNLVIAVSDSTREVANYGKGDAKGIELSIDKKADKRFWGNINYSYSISSAENGEGKYYSNWDQRHIINIIGGYRISKSFDINLKWRYATGRPYTPVLGREQHPVTGQWLPIKGDLNSSRYPDYHRLDFKFIYNASLGNYNVALYLALWNVYNHKNILVYKWDKEYRRRDEIYQFLFMPVGGIEIGF